MNTNTIALILTFLVLIGSGCAGSKSARTHPDDIYGARAYRYFLDGDMPAAVDLYKRAYASARKADRGVLAARYLSNIGRAFYEMGAADSASAYSVKAYGEFIMFSDSLGASSAAAFLAICRASSGDGEQARKWLLAASRPNAPKGRAHYLAVAKGMVDYRLSSAIDNESAVDAALAYCKKRQDHPMLSTIYILKADVELAKGNCAAASPYLDSALNSIGKSREKYKGSGALLKLSAIKLCAGDARAGKHYYERAVDCAPKGAAVPALEEVSARCERLCR
ncbi:MAG: hypothetical protein LBH93_08725 [Chitinispirillales bacterium]|jgi:tetratricopeptide (TPR) repeat protein|nr:hypothetical protein [Chitinispirillales bacterium]